LKRTGTGIEWPLGWPLGGFPAAQGKYYCSIGDGNAFGRPVIEAMIRCAVSCGLKISGINGEVAPGQWEYQVGIAEGMECGDHQWITRYLLNRIGEEFGVTTSFEPKPAAGDWNGSGCHMNFSTEKTRNEGGLEYILEHCMKKLSAKHKEHITVYGEDNNKRLTGKHETSSIDKFNFGEGNRAASVRIPVTTFDKGYGFFEDRRPASNIDPYLISAMMVDTICLNSKYC
jgi:glutamine synthetase